MPAPSELKQPYRFYYWPEIPGRGEFVRLAFEASGADYIEVVKDWAELSSPMLELEGRILPRPPLAPPFLVFGDEVIGQTANILAFLGQRHGLAPSDATEQRWLNQLQLSIMDWANEVHDTHHPIAPELHYEDQKSEASRRCRHYLKVRQPKYLDYFEQLILRSTGPYLLGRTVSYADLSLMFMIEGLQFAFPNAMRRDSQRTPLLFELAQTVLKQERIARYWNSSKRRPFKDGLFRHYPELDPAANSN